MEEIDEIKDRLTWSFQFSSIIENEELNDSDKIEVSKSFENLKLLFGENFLIDLYNSRHPLVSHFYNHAAWTRKWIAWFSDSLFMLKDQTNFKSLIERIKDPNKYNEGLSVLEIADKFNISNLVADFEPKIIAHHKEKMPDLYIRSEETTEDFYIEVSTLLQSENLIKNTKLTKNLFISHGIKYSGQLFRNLENKEYDEIKNEINIIAEQAFKENRMVLLYIPGIIELALGPIFNSIELKAWCDKKDYRIGSFILPQENFNPSLRLKRKVQSKQKQLPKDKPNILALKFKDVHSLWVDKSSLISSVEEAINKYDHLFAVIIFDHHWGSPQDELIIQDMNFFISKSKGHIVVENSFVFFNKFSKVKITPNLMNDIFNALIHN